MLNDYKYAIGSMKQAGDYNKITTYLILHIRKTSKHGSDIVNAIENQGTFNFNPSAPRRKISSTVKAEDSTPQEKLEIKCESNHNRKFIKTLSKAPCLVALRMSLILHLLLFAQSI